MKPTRLTLGAILFFVAVAVGPQSASANPFPKGNAASGKKLHDPRCFRIKTALSFIRIYFGRPILLPSFAA
jgi:hypothetical protein